ncbi:cation:proton antiporter [Chakrabartyella piscis]|uniref:cation:proton antiporter n=1 Tax=Chakrabartyella piscis TaxID=2918914 RepID=UPI00295859EB|nr:cation:proton antiporter [Chakrabartyella piscis]
MLLSLALIFIVGMLLGGVCNHLRLPALLGMLISGMILGPYAMDLLDGNLLAISADIRKIALIIILTRVGFNLDVGDLKRIGLPAVLMCFVPACAEITAMILIAPRLFDITIIDAAIMGSVVAAVSPAVIVPKMLNLIDLEYGKDKGIPQMIMAGASVDDVFVIVLFSSFLTLGEGGEVNYASFLHIPISIILGIAVGAVVGYVLHVFFMKKHMRDSAKVILVLGISMLLTVQEDFITGIVGFSGLIAIMSMGLMMQLKKPDLAKRLSAKYNKLWVCAEILLFTLVGATVDLSYALKFGAVAAVLILAVLVFRMLAVYFCLWKTNFNSKEKVFCMIGYCPKATVQAAIGSIPLAMGLACGELVLTVAVLSILITAPIGAFAIDLTHKKLLKQG